MPDILPVIAAIYSNHQRLSNNLVARFIKLPALSERAVRAEKLDANKFRITGEGHIFEANFNWIVEDGHNELKKGFETTDAGAPNWGKFDFIIEVQKRSENSTLTLILFESSAKDGSPQHELPVVLD